VGQKFAIIPSSEKPEKRIIGKIWGKLLLTHPVCNGHTSRMYSEEYIELLIPENI